MSINTKRELLLQRMLDYVQRNAMDIGIVAVFIMSVVVFLLP